MNRRKLGKVIHRIGVLAINGDNVLLAHKDDEEVKNVIVSWPDMEEAPLLMDSNKNYQCETLNDYVEAMLEYFNDGYYVWTVELNETKEVRFDDTRRDIKRFLKFVRNRYPEYIDGVKYRWLSDRPIVFWNDDWDEMM